MRIGIDCRLWNESGVGRYLGNLVEQLLIIDRKNNYTLFVLSKDIENIKYQILASRRSGSNIKYRGTFNKTTKTGTEDCCDYRWRKRIFCY